MKQSWDSTSALGLSVVPGGNAAASSSVPRSTAAGSSRVTVLKTTGLSVAEISSSSLV